jgi:arginine decarboxylase
MMVPKELFLTKGVGRHKDRLTAFEMALRNAKIGHFNLVTVSSIIPPYAKVIGRKKGINKLKDGQIVYCVMSRNQTDENARLVAASVGLAIPADRSRFGYLSEYHSFGETNMEAGDYAEDVAASMLATIMGVDFDPDLAWNEKEEIFKISGKIVNTRNITQSAIGQKGVWTSVLAAAVFVS